MQSGSDKNNNSTDEKTDVSNSTDDETTQLIKNDRALALRLSLSDAGVSANTRSEGRAVQSGSLGARTLELVSRVGEAGSPPRPKGKRRCARGLSGAVSTTTGDTSPAGGPNPVRG